MSATDTAPVMDHELVLTRVFDAPREKLFRAWTEPELLKQWFAPLPYTTSLAELDVRPGGANLIVMRSPDGEEFGGAGEYLVITRPERLVFTWTWDGHEGHEGTQLIEVEFRKKGVGTTTVTLTNRGLRDEESRRSHRRGWEASFDNLEQILGP